MVRVAIVGVTLVAGLAGRWAFADPAPVRRTPLSWSTGVLILRQSNARRWELAGGGSAGWRDLVDVAARYHATDRWSAAARLRLDRDGTRADEVELAYVLAPGKMMFPGDLLARTDLVVDAGAGVAMLDRMRPLAFSGARLRFQPRTVSMLAVELGVRALWAPVERMPPAIEHRLATEVMVSAAVMWPFERYIDGP